MIEYVSPKDLSELQKIDSGYIDAGGVSFPCVFGVPNLIYPQQLTQSDQSSLEWYQRNARDYDEYLPITFQTFGVNEDQERDKLVSKLELKSGETVLEIGCGTGRDSLKIAEKIGATGALYLQDISYEILQYAIKKFETLDQKPTTHFSLANGSYLPFNDNVFDKVFHFGGINTFGEKRRALSEMVRVVKPGGKIVVGDENMPDWLRDTEFGRVLMNSNPHYKYHVPFQDLPIEARNVSVEWVIGGVFYVISFEKGMGEPYADLDFMIPGERGGTHRTRYFGHLEGLSAEAVDLAKSARAARGVSMFDWLNEAVKIKALEDLKNTSHDQI